MILLTEIGLARLWLLIRVQRITKGKDFSLCTAYNGNPEWGFAVQVQFSDDDNKFLQLLSMANKVEKHLLKND